MLKSLLLLCAASCVVSATTTYTVTVDVIQDEQDYLILKGNVLEWEHLSGFANGGVTGGTVNGLVNVKGTTVNPHNPYILVSGADSANAGLNFTNSDWYNGMQGLQCGGGAQLTCPFFDSGASYEFTLPFLLYQITSISVSKLVAPGGGTLAVQQQPNSGNGYQAIVNFDDTAVSGQNEYKAQITLTGPDVPEPGSIGLAGIGLLWVGLVARKRIVQ